MHVLIPCNVIVKFLIKENKERNAYQYHARWQANFKDVLTEFRPIFLVLTGMF